MNNKIATRGDFIKIKYKAITKFADYTENKEKQNQVKKYEKEIDDMVYKLYALTADEIKIAGNSGK